MCKCPCNVQLSCQKHWDLVRQNKRTSTHLWSAQTNSNVIILLPPTVLALRHVQELRQRWNNLFITRTRHTHQWMQLCKICHSPHEVAARQCEQNASSDESVGSGTSSGKSQLRRKCPQQRLALAKRTFGEVLWVWITMNKSWGLRRLQRWRRSGRWMPWWLVVVVGRGCGRSRAGEWSRTYLSALDFKLSSSHSLHN